MVFKSLANICVYENKIDAAYISAQQAFELLQGRPRNLKYPLINNSDSRKPRPRS
ncbi:hypothetical protein GPUN_1983 [Glaciecola punicea ACAM 611]|uniref:Uncharacterized protein n=1 Tax=Glaciecola punicea ACAM 611 TaxID=1121923 RepID=H5TCS1_9ALTE|nr:hypothetical protein GPUN_1983 [Glaciecola punicea ACAM 611]